MGEIVALRSDGATRFDAALRKIHAYVEQTAGAERDADRGSLDVAAEIVTLYEDPDCRAIWLSELPPIQRTHFRGRPIDPVSFSRFSKWLKDRGGLQPRTTYQLRAAHELTANYLRPAQIKPSRDTANHGDRHPFSPGGPTMTTLSRRPAAPHWTEREVRLMLELLDSGASAAEVGRRLGRTKLAIQDRAIKARREGLVAAPRNCERCGKRLARLNLANTCFACLGPVA